MAVKISLSIDVKKTSKRLRNFERKKLPAMVQKSLNRAIKGVVTDAIRGPNNVVKERINMKSKDLRRRLRVTLARGNNGIASVTVASRKPPNLISYGAKAKSKAVRGKKRLAGKGVSARAWEKRRVYKGSFVAPVAVAGGGARNIVLVRDRSKSKTSPSSGTYASKRIKRGPRAGQPIKRQPLKAVFGPSLQRVFTRKTKTGEAPTRILSSLGRKRFIKELNGMIRRLQK